MVANYHALEGIESDAATREAAILPLLDGGAAAGAAFDGTVPEGSAIRILTGALLPLVQAAPDSRVVVVSSTAATRSPSSASTSASSRPCSPRRRELGVATLRTSKK